MNIQVGLYTVVRNDSLFPVSWSVAHPPQLNKCVWDKIWMCGAFFNPKDLLVNLKWVRLSFKILNRQSFPAEIPVYVRSSWAEPGHVAPNQVQSWVLFFHLLRSTSCAEWQSRNPPVGPLFLESSQEVRHPDEGITSLSDPDLTGMWNPPLTRGTAPRLPPNTPSDVEKHRPCLLLVSEGNVTSTLLFL